MPLSNFLHSFVFNTSVSPAPEQPVLLIWFQHLTSPKCASHQTSQAPAFIGFQYLYYIRQEVQRPSPCDSSGVPPLPILPSSSFFNFYSSHLFRPFTYAGESAPLEGIHLVSMSKLPPPLCLSVPAFIHLVSRLPLWPLDNSLHASLFEFALVSQLLVSQQPLALFWFQCLTLALMSLPSNS